eukprot:SAG31_NODE_350_length_17241_cov_156.139715_11_plen_171_part_00
MATAKATKKPSDRRVAITECARSAELKDFLLDLEEDRVGGKVFRMKSPPGRGLIVDVARIRALHSILRQLILVSFDSSVPDVIMGSLDSIKTEKDIRGTMASQTDYIDVQRSLDHMTNKVDHAHFKSTNMKAWRKAVDEHVASKVDDPDCISLINKALDSWVSLHLSQSG